MQQCAPSIVRFRRPLLFSPFSTLFLTPFAYDLSLSLVDPLLDCLCTFLEASIHQLLHNRGVYPNELFERTKLFNIPVHRMRSIEVCEYISDVVSSAKHWLQSDLVESLVLQLNDAATGAMLENFIFELHGTSLLCSLPSHLTSKELDTLLLQLESTLRSFLVRSTQAGSRLGGNLEARPSAAASLTLTPSDERKSPALPFSWKIFLLTYEVEEGASLLWRMAWIEAEEDEISVPGDVAVTPIRSHTKSSGNALDGFTIQLLVEKSQTSNT